MGFVAHSSTNSLWGENEITSSFVAYHTVMPQCFCMNRFIWYFALQEHRSSLHLEFKTELGNTKICGSL